MKKIAVLLYATVCMAVLVAAVNTGEAVPTTPAGMAAATCAAKAKGKDRFTCYEEVARMVVMEHEEDYNRQLNDLEEWFRTEKKPFFLLHCNSHANDACKGGKLCGSEFFAKGADNSQALDIQKGLGRFVFTRLVQAGPEGLMKYRTFTYSLDKNSHCFLIDPAVLRHQPFYAFKGDSGKNGVAPGNRDPFAVAEEALSWDNYIKNNVQEIKDIVKSGAATNEIVIAGCIDMQYVRAIDTKGSCDAVKACVARGMTCTANKSLKDGRVSLPAAAAPLPSNDRKQQGAEGLAPGSFAAKIKQEEGQQ